MTAVPLLTTGDVARALGVSQHAVIEWCKRNQLPHVFIQSGAAHPHRRIYRDEALLFAEKMGLRWQEEEEAKHG